MTEMLKTLKLSITAARKQPQEPPSLPKAQRAAGSAPSSLSPLPCRVLHGNTHPPQVPGSHTYHPTLVPRRENCSPGLEEELLYNPATPPARGSCPLPHRAEKWEGKGEVSSQAFFYGKWQIFEDNKEKGNGLMKVIFLQ